MSAWRIPSACAPGPPPTSPECAVHRPGPCASGPNPPARARHFLAGHFCSTCSVAFHVPGPILLPSSSLWSAVLQPLFWAAAALPTHRSARFLPHVPPRSLWLPPSPLVPSVELRHSARTNSLAGAHLIPCCRPQFALKRKTFGKTLVEHPVIRWKLAEMARQARAPAPPAGARRKGVLQAARERSEGRWQGAVGSGSDRKWCSGQVLYCSPSPPPRFRFVASASPWSTPSSRAGFLPPAAVMGIGSCNAALEARKGHPFVALGSDPLHLSHVCGLPLAGGRWMRPMQLWRT